MQEREVSTVAFRTVGPPSLSLDECNHNEQNCQFTNCDDVHEVVITSATLAESLALIRREMTSSRLLSGVNAVAVGLSATQSGDSLVGSSQLNGENLARKLARAGHPGQILTCPNVAAVCMKDHPGIGVLSLGEYVLDLDLPPTEVFQLALSQTAMNYPPIRSCYPVRHNLSSRGTPFFGRNKEIDAIRNLLRANRIVTIAGPVGIGKSSLAWRLGIEVAPEFPGGVWQIWVGHGSTLDSLLNDTEHVLGLPTGSLSGSDQPARNVPILFLIDGCETAIAECRLFCEALLLYGLEVQIVATSKERLAIRDEATFVVGPLSYRTSQNADSSVGFLDFEAHRLLYDRIQTLSTALQLSSGIASELCEICSLVRGNPAMLLTAAAMYVRHGMAHLKQRLSSLDADCDDLAEQGEDRICAVMVESLSQLSDVALSVIRDSRAFAGQWNYSSLSCVCCELDGVRLRDAMFELINAGVAEINFTAEGEIKFGLTNAFENALSGQVAFNKPSAKAILNHFKFYLELAESVSVKAESDYRHIRRNIANVRLAISRGLAGLFVPEDVLRLVLALGPYWHRHGPLREAAEICRRACEISNQSDSWLLARTLNLCGTFLTAVARYEEAAQIHFNAKEKAERMSDELTVAMSLANLAMVRRHQGRLIEAKELGFEAVRRLRLVGDKHRLAGCMANLGSVLEELEEFDDSDAVLKDSESQFRAIGDRWPAARIRFNIAELALHRGNLIQASIKYVDVFRESVEIEDPTLTALSLEGLGIAHFKVGDATIATTLIGVAAKVREENGCPRSARQSDRLGLTEDCLRKKIGATKFETLLNSSRALSLAQVFELLSDNRLEAVANS